MQCTHMEMLGRGKGCHLDFSHFLILRACIFSHYGDIFLFCGPWWFLCLPLTRFLWSSWLVLVLVPKHKYFITPISTKPHLSLWFEISHVFHHVLLNYPWISFRNTKVYITNLPTAGVDWGFCGLEIYTVLETLLKKNKNIKLLSYQN